MLDQKFKVGIVVIGSLLWDNNLMPNDNLRADWRRINLNVEQKISLLLPIRYGRKSGRGKNYTMVYDYELITTKKMGIGYLLPLKEKESSIHEIIYQASILSRAEGDNSRTTSKLCEVVKGQNDAWAVISCMVNPKITDSKKNALLNTWSNRTNISSLNYEKFTENEGVNLFSRNGMIENFWPQPIDVTNNIEVNTFDVLITTITKKNIANFPTDEELLEDAKKDQRKYFYNNISNGINTFQDIDIINYAHNTAATPSS